jgi:hypothetical protein
MTGMLTFCVWPVMAPSVRNNAGTRRSGPKAPPCGMPGGPITGNQVARCSWRATPGRRPGPGASGGTPQTARKSLYVTLPPP